MYARTYIRHGSLCVLFRAQGGAQWIDATLQDFADEMVVRMTAYGSRELDPRSGDCGGIFP